LIIEFGKKFGISIKFFFSNRSEKSTINITDIADKINYQKIFQI